MVTATNTIRSSSLFLVPLTLVLLSGCEGVTVISKRPPLHDAVKDGDLDKVKLLIEKGEDVNQKDFPEGATPLHYAALYGRKDIADLLISKGASVDSKDTRQEATPLHMAVVAGHVDMAELLLENGADVDVRDGRAGPTPLHCASMVFFDKFYGIDMPPPQAALIELLPSHGADIEATYSDGLRPIHLACGEGHLSAVKALLANGASLEKKAGDPYSTLELARQAGHTEIVRLIEEHVTGKVATPYGDEQPQEEDKTETVEMGGFRVKIPSVWMAAPKSDEEELKDTVLAGAKQMFDAEEGWLEINHFHVFNTPEQDTVMIYHAVIPEEQEQKQKQIRLPMRQMVRFTHPPL